MAVLANTERQAAWAEMMRALSDDREPCAISKTALRAALDAADSWVDSNAASFNQALPQPARNSLTAQQKARLLLFVVRRRWEVS